jgi:hypothetical protein
MIFDIHAEQTRAQERAIHEIERLVEILEGEMMSFGFAGGLRQVRQIK